MESSNATDQYNFERFSQFVCKSYNIRSQLRSATLGEWDAKANEGEVDVSDDEKKNELKTLEEWDIVSFGISSFKDQLGTIKRLEADGAKVGGTREVMVHVAADTVQNDRFWRKVGGKVLGGNYVI